MQDVPQTQPLPGMAANNAGGFCFVVDDMTRLRRFLALGVEGGTYYTGEREMALDNAQALSRLLDAGRGAEVVAEVVEWSTNGRAAKQSPMLFALAACARLGDAPTKAAAYAALPRVCRIPTHLFSFVGYCKDLSTGNGWGRAHRRAITAWYLGRNPQQLAQLVTKYKSREGYSHQDILRLTHIKATSEAQAVLLRYVAKGWEAVRELTDEQRADEQLAGVHAFLAAVEEAKTAEEDRLLELIRAHGLVREHIPTTQLSSKPVWQSLLAEMPMTAMLRNLAKMTSIGLLEPLGDHTATVCDRLRNAGALRGARVHPFNILVALRTYASGHGHKGSLAWTPVPEITAALDDAFNLAFQAVVPTGKRHLLALDVSGSMSCGKVNGSGVISPREAAAALSMVTMRTEPRTHTIAFQDQIVPLAIDASMSLETVINATQSLPFGSTDCSAPMLYALEHGIKADVFVVYTDNETYHGSMHPSKALLRYREQTGIDARLIVIAFTATAFTIADPADRGMLDMCGFDAAGPEIIRSFVAGEL